MVKIMSLNSKFLSFGFLLCLTGQISDTQRTVLMTTAIIGGDHHCYIGIYHIVNVDEDAGVGGDGDGSA